jgi:hypothetical protein
VGYINWGALSMVIALAVSFGMLPFYILRKKIWGGIKKWFKSDKKKPAVSETHQGR